MIAPQVNFDIAMKEQKQPPPIVKKPVSFFNDKQTPALGQSLLHERAPAKQQAKQPAPAHAPAHAHVQVSEADDITTELEEMSIGFQGLMEGNVKPNKPKRTLTPAQLANLAKMRETKALKREETKKAKLVLPQAPQQPSSNPPNLHQQDFSSMFKQHFEQHYSEKEAIRQREKAIRQEAKQKVLSKLMTQQKLQAPTPALGQSLGQSPRLLSDPSLLREPAPKPIESTVGKKLRYKMSPFGGIDTYFE